MNVKPPFKHFEDPRGWTELCSGRPGWSNRKTDDRAQVTCKSCLRTLARYDASAAAPPV